VAELERKLLEYMSKNNVAPAKIEQPVASVDPMKLKDLENRLK